MQQNVCISILLSQTFYIHIYIFIIEAQQSKSAHPLRPQPSKCGTNFPIHCLIYTCIYIYIYMYICAPGGPLGLLDSLAPWAPWTPSGTLVSSDPSPLSRNRMGPMGLLSSMCSLGPLQAYTYMRIYMHRGETYQGVPRETTQCCAKTKVEKAVPETTVA